MVVEAVSEGRHLGVVVVEAGGGEAVADRPKATEDVVRVGLAFKVRNPEFVDVDPGLRWCFL